MPDCLFLQQHAYIRRSGLNEHLLGRVLKVYNNIEDSPWLVCLLINIEQPTGEEILPQVSDL